MTIEIVQATQDHVDELLGLYFSVYGSSYPLTLGTDKKTMSGMISSGNCLWLLARCTDKNRVVGSVVFALDWQEKIGKLEGVVVHEEYRRRNIANKMIGEGTRRLLLEDDSINSIYTTTRTLSRGPQLMCLKDGFIPLGIFPNAHRLSSYETVTLLVKYRPGILEKRQPPSAIPEKLAPLWKAMNDDIGSTNLPRLVQQKPAAALGKRLDFEIIEAEHFVKNRFYQTFKNPGERFYPFHIPNVLIASTTGGVELYACLSKPDRYCPIVASTARFYSLAGSLEPLIYQLCDNGAEYLETLVDMDDTASIEVLLDEDFLPSAMYPAMKEINGRLYDYVVMSRTMIPLNFRGMDIVRVFKPYIDQYVELWKQMHIETLEVFNDYESSFGH